MAQSIPAKLVCSICLEDFKVPKLLPCFHTFCLLCLESYVEQVESSNGKFDCPLCRAITEVPVGGVSQFQTNFYIGLSERQIEITEYCDVCDRSSEKTATTTCLDCEEFLCDDCSWYHKKMKISREHRLLELGSAGNGSNNARKIRSNRYCKQHPKEEIKMACIDCDEALCIVCKLTDHENHNTKDTKSVAESMRTELHDIAVKVDNDMVQIANNIEIIKNKMMQSGKLQEEEKNKLEKHTTLYIEKIKANMVQLQEEIDQSYRKDMDQLQATLSDLQSSQRNIQHLASMTKRIEETADDAAVISLGTQLKKQVKLVVKSDSDIESRVTIQQLMFTENTPNIRLGALEGIKERNKRAAKEKLDQIPKLKKDVTEIFRKKLHERFPRCHEFLGSCMLETNWPQCKDMAFKIKPLSTLNISYHEICPTSGNADIVFLLSFKKFSYDFTELKVAVKELCASTDKQFNKLVTQYLLEVETCLKLEEQKKANTFRFTDKARMKVFLYATSFAICRYSECLSLRYSVDN